MRRTRLRGLLVFALGFCASTATTARAHGEPHFGERSFVVDGEIVGGETTWGVVTAGAEGLRRVCDESLPPGSSFTFRLNDGTLVTGTETGLFVSADGCAHQALPTPLDGRGAIEIGELRDGRLIVLSADAAIFVGADLPSLTEVLPPVGQTQLFDLAVSAVGDRVVVTGARVDVATGFGAPVVLFSDDGAASFTAVDVDLAEFLFVTALTFDLDDRTALIGATDGEGVGQLLQVDLEAATATSIATFAAGVTHGVVFNGARFVISRLVGELFKQADGEGAFVQLGDPTTAPTDCIAVADDGLSLVGCGRGVTLSAGLFSQSFDEGVTWETVVGSDVPYRVCPAGSEGLSRCVTFVETRCRDGQDDDSDGLTDADDPDCPPEAPDDGDANPRPDEPRSGARSSDGRGCAGGDGSSDLSVLAALVVLVSYTRTPRRRASGERT